MPAQQCIFCSIASGQTPSRKIYSDNVCQAFLDINPSSKGQLVLTPIRHVSGIHDLSNEELAHIAVIIKNLVMLQLQSLGCEGVNVIYPLGEIAGQRSEHMITYLIPRYKDDKVRILMEPLKSSEQEINDIFSTLKGAMAGGMPVVKHEEKKPPKVIKEEKPKVIKEKKKEKVPGYW